MRLLRIVVLSILLMPPLAAAQQGGGQQASPCMPGMPMSGCPDSSAQQSGDGQSAQQGGPEEGPGAQMGKTGLMSMQRMQPQTFLQAIVHHASSGTSAEPDSTPTPMLMVQRGRWMLMFHAKVFVLDEQQS